MELHSQIRTTISFGSFDFDPETGELRRGEDRVRLARQPMRILIALLAHPGALITREQLRDELWADTTFVDFDQGLNAAVNRLRRTLGDSAEKPRYIETDPGRGYRFIGFVKVAPPAPSSLPPAESPVEAAQGRLRPWIWVTFAATAVALVAAASLRWFAPAAPPEHWNLTQFTADPGRNETPALSPDGRFVAYSSERNQEGSRDLYVKQIAGGEPVRLTFDGAANTSPDFSPDGTNIVFQSNRKGGGIYEIPALGGEQRLLAPEGQDPRYSPDGTHIAFWIGSPDVAIAIPGSGTVWIAPASGGPARRLAADLTSASHPIWSPDGRHLLVAGYQSSKPYESSAVDWWYIALDGQPAVAAGARQLLDRVGVPRRGGDRSIPVPLPRVPFPRCWTRDNTILFSNQDADTSNLWEMPISLRTGKITGSPIRLSSGSGNETHPSCQIADTLAFVDLDMQTNLWRAAIDTGRPDSSSLMERITLGHA